MGDTPLIDSKSRFSINLNTAFYDVMFGFHGSTDNGLNPLEALICRQIKDRMATKSKMSPYVPVLPSIFAELLAELKRDDVDFARVSAIIKNDPLMSAAVIETANRPFFRRTESEVVAIDEAVSNLGLNKSAAIVFDLIMKQMMTISPGYFERFGGFLWEHSKDCAVVCQELGKQHKEDVSLCYLMGLVHDIGKLVILSFIAETGTVVDMNSNLGSAGFKTFLASTVNEVSGAAVSEWALPASICQAISMQKASSLGGLDLILYQGNLLADLYRFVNVGYIDERCCFEILLEHDIPEDEARCFFAVLDQQKAR